MNASDLTLQEVLALKPVFYLSHVTKHVESNISDVFMSGGGSWSPDVGRQFVLNVAERRMGFGQVDDVSRLKAVETLPDGTDRWWFDDLFCVVWKHNREKRRLVEATNTYRFDSVNERDAALELFVRAMKAYDARVLVDALAEPKVEVRFTDRALQRLQTGEFVA